MHSKTKEIFDSCRTVIGSCFIITAFVLTVIPFIILTLIYLGFIALLCGAFFLMAVIPALLMPQEVLNSLQATPNNVDAEPDPSYQDIV